MWTNKTIYSSKSEKAMAPHSSTLAWKIPWTEEPGGLQSMGWLRVRQDWATSLSLFTFMHWRRKWQPTPVFFPGESQKQWAPVYGVAQSRTRLKWLSSNLYFCLNMSFKRNTLKCFSYAYYEQVLLKFKIMLFHISSKIISWPTRVHPTFWKSLL